MRPTLPCRFDVRDRQPRCHATNRIRGLEFRRWSLVSNSIVCACHDRPPRRPDDALAEVERRRCRRSRPPRARGLFRAARDGQAVPQPRATRHYPGDDAGPRSLPAIAAAGARQLPEPARLLRLRRRSDAPHPDRSHPGAAVGEARRQAGSGPAQRRPPVHRSVERGHPRSRSRAHRTGDLRRVARRSSSNCARSSAAAAARPPICSASPSPPPSATSASLGPGYRSASSATTRSGITTPSAADASLWNGYCASA